MLVLFLMMNTVDTVTLFVKQKTNVFFGKKLNENDL
nr:MAG TPA: Protein of unknown function (DUF2023) [Caudoviricetes sp.]